MTKLHHIIEGNAGNKIYIEFQLKEEIMKSAYMVNPKSPRRSPKLTLRTPLATASRKTSKGEVHMSKEEYNN